MKCSSPLPLVWHLSDCSHLLGWVCAPRRNRSCLTPTAPVTARDQSGSKPAVSVSLQGWCFLILIRREYAFLMSYDLTSPGIIRWDGKWWWTVIAKFTYKKKTSWATHVYKEYRLLRISVFDSCIWDWEAWSQVPQDTYLQNVKSQIVERLGKQEKKSDHRLVFPKRMHWMFLANGSRFHYSFILIHFQEGVLGFLCEERRSKQNAATHWGPWSPKRTKAFLMDLVCISQGLLSTLYKGR